MPSFPSLEQLFERNSKWAENINRDDPEFLQEGVKGQSPKVFWVGCADARIPETTITGSRPGDILTHRNVANQFHPDDDTSLAVLTFAVDFAGVEHVVVVGHTGCGGTTACLKASSSFAPGQPCTPIPELPADSPLNRWLTPLTTLAASLNLSKDDELTALVEANVKKQVENLSKTEIIQNAWKNKSKAGKDVWVHGWVYELESGKLRDLGVTKGPEGR